MPKPRRPGVRPCTAIIHTTPWIMRRNKPHSLKQSHTHTPEPARLLRPTADQAGLCWTTWWLWRGDCTRSHPELGRENPQRPWYCVLRRGRVGRRQVFQHSPTHHTITPTTAGWSSPVARQAHNLKVIGSNPIPATKIPQTHTRPTHSPQAAAAGRSALLDPSGP